MMRRCWRCQEMKGRNSYYNDTGWCKDCRSNYHIERTYNLTREQHEALLSSQNRLCAICEHDLGTKPVVDHDHETGKVRGILCCGCNLGIGNLRDSINVLERATRYLIWNRATSNI